MDRTRRNVSWTRWLLLSGLLAARPAAALDARGSQEAFEAQARMIQLKAMTPNPGGELPLEPQTAPTREKRRVAISPGLVTETCRGWVKFKSEPYIKFIRVTIISTGVDNLFEVKVISPVDDKKLYTGEVALVFRGAETPPGGCSMRHPEGCQTVPYDDEYRGGSNFRLSVPVVMDDFFDGPYVWGDLKLQGDEFPVICRRQHLL